MSPPIEPAVVLDEAPAQTRVPARWNRRRLLVMAAAGLLVLLVLAASAFLPVPYVILAPGPTKDTLGSLEGKPLIAIEGQSTYPTSGRLDLTTVEVYGGPDSQISLFSAVRSWFDPSVAVVPQETVFPRGETEKQVEEHNVREMKASQNAATTAALRELDYPVTTQIIVGGVVPDAPAHGKLKEGDVIVAMDGAPVTSRDQVVERVRRHAPGETVTFSIVREGAGQEVAVPTTSAADDPRHAIVGIVPSAQSQYPFQVTIGLEDIGGPSAGLMFALGIADKLTPGDLTGGTFVAGTGTITEEGQVGPIGGIQQKLLGARRAGATVFLTPEGNCPAATPVRPEGLRLVKVTRLADAMASLEALRTGNGPVPSCSG